METYIFEVFHLIFRYFHIVAGIAWIGASFYFVWLDNNLQAPPIAKQKQGIQGDLWAIHAGGIYEVAKYSSGPSKMPKHLHWFKWEAYSTWISGALLFSLLYYVGADVYLIDVSKNPLEKVFAIATSVAFIGVGYALYRGLCNTKLLYQGRLFLVVAMAILTLWTFLLDQLFSDRAVYIHIGALVGTCMAGNVFHVIVPSQKYMVESLNNQVEPDPLPATRAKLVSIHNNYATLPILFIMLSNHFAFTYAHEFGWLILIAIFIVGMWIRHFFNLKNRGVIKPWILVTGLIAFLLLMASIAPWPTINNSQQNNQQAALTVDDASAWKIINRRCTECHSAQPTSTMFKSPPSGFILDNITQAKNVAALIHNRAAILKDMPLGNLTQMTDEERTHLALWFKTLSTKP
ncbi:urate hydroxylase PuuD [Gayadomonas joobiniege]|uniref:urate hydroxylase PuuD n=1 Tax=Gayadomonas joobiniege TaxID=1234606 RepID=UPI000361D3C8|nr:urate hydroxylase PuuD [Gayadomonas joobiniege]